MDPQLSLEISRMKKFCVFIFLRSFQVLKILNMKFLGKVCEKKLQRRSCFLVYFGKNFNFSKPILPKTSQLQTSTEKPIRNIFSIEKILVKAGDL